MIRLARPLAALGNIIGLRSTESDITVTVEGKWSGRFDPVRLGLTILLVLGIVFGGVCTAFSLANDPAPGLLTQGPYHMPGS